MTYDQKLDQQIDPTEDNGFHGKSRIPWGQIIKVVGDGTIHYYKDGQPCDEKGKLKDAPLPD
jgi:hypothetical protein